MKKFLLFILPGVILAGLIALPGAGAEDGVTWDLRWSGGFKSSPQPAEGWLEKTLDGGGTLTNRGDFRLFLPGAGLTLRAQGLDKRRLPPGEPGVTNPGLGLYYDGGGAWGKLLGESRLLWGVLDETGLPARTGNVWAKAPPFTAGRRFFQAELKTTAQDREPAVCLLLGFPAGGALTARLAAELAGGDGDAAPSPLLGGGLEARWEGGRAPGSVRVEGMWSRKTLPARRRETWFSPAALLPERETSLAVLGVVVEVFPQLAPLPGGTTRAASRTRSLTLAGDLACSETFALGRGLYGNLALTLSDKPWRLYLAADSAGEAYVGRDGVATGAGFRGAARLERQFPRAGLLRAGVEVRVLGKSLGAAVNEGALTWYYSPPTPSGKARPLLGLARASGAVTWDASGEAPLGGVEALAGVYGPAGVEAVVSGELRWAPGAALEDAFYDAKAAATVSWSPGPLDLSLHAGGSFPAGKAPVWDAAVSLQARSGSWGRFSLKAASPKFPAKWEYTLGWTLTVKPGRHGG